mmetsp:Transcript_7710/g.21811  ORF Transcript_7710/g.21811 Transcript_7710/m.21811 type:complete len:229 (+) Transcript_7710:377-1063(+)
MMSAPTPHAPELARGVRGAGDQEPAVVAEAEGEDGALMAGVRRNMLVRRTGIPEVYEAILGGRGEQPPVGGEGQAAHGAVMAREAAEALAGAQHPEPGAAVETACGNHAGVGREGQCGDGALVAVNHVLLPAGDHAPDADEAVHAACGHPPAPGREGHGEHRPARGDPVREALAAARLHAPQPGVAVLVGRRYEELGVADGREHGAVSEACLPDRGLAVQDLLARGQQ